MEITRNRLMSINVFVGLFSATSSYFYHLRKNKYIFITSFLITPPPIKALFTLNLVVYFLLSFLLLSYRKLNLTYLLKVDINRQTFSFQGSDWVYILVELIRISDYSGTLHRYLWSMLRDLTCYLDYWESWNVILEVCGAVVYANISLQHHAR